MKIIIITLSLICVLFAQSEQPYPPLELVSIPTAGTLPKGSYTYETILTKNGGVTPKLAVGLTDNLTFGFAYGIHNLIGDQKPNYNPQPGFIIKYRVYSETTKWPAIVLGLNTQGKGNYMVKDGFIGGRYEKKALGFYLTASKNWNMMGNFGVHLGLSKNSWEDLDGDDDLNFFVGIDKELNRSFSLLLECDGALNDNQYEESSKFLRKAYFCPSSNSGITRYHFIYNQKKNGKPSSAYGRCHSGSKEYLEFKKANLNQDLEFCCSIHKDYHPPVIGFYQLSKKTNKKVCSPSLNRYFKVPFLNAGSITVDRKSGLFDIR